jgi:hypothetical protein
MRVHRIAPHYCKVCVNVIAAILIYQNRATALTFTLQNATFDDNGTATGSFDYNTGTNTFSNYNITTTSPSTSNFVPFTYNTTNSSIFGSSNKGFTVDDSGGVGHELNLYFQSPLASTSTTNPIDTTHTNSNENSIEKTDSSAGVVRYFVSGGATSQAQGVPFEFEPTQGAILGVPLFLGMRWFKKKIKHKGRVRKQSNNLA